MAHGLAPRWEVVGAEDLEGAGGEISLHRNQPVPVLLGAPSVLEHPAGGGGRRWYVVWLSEHGLKLGLTPRRQPGSSTVLRT